MKRKYKQWELPNGVMVEIPNGRKITFLKMDGMYAKWRDGGAVATGKFEEFIKDGDIYKVIK
jgi:hypothetical protein